MLNVDINMADTEYDILKDIREINYSVLTGVNTAVSYLEGQYESTKIPVTYSFLNGKSLESNVEGPGNTWNTVLTVDNVPEGSKIYFWMPSAVTAGNHLDVRIVGTDSEIWYTKNNNLVGTDRDPIGDLSGSIIKTSGGTGPVSIQARSESDGYWAVRGDDVSTTWICCTDASNPIILTGAPQSHEIGGKHEITKLKMFYAPGTTTDYNAATVIHHTAIQNDRYWEYASCVNEVNHVRSVTGLQVGFNEPPVWVKGTAKPVLFIVYEGFTFL